MWVMWTYFVLYSIVATIYVYRIVGYLVMKMVYNGIVVRFLMNVMMALLDDVDDDDDDDIDVDIDVDGV